jgi:hypothetical protein
MSACEECEDDPTFDHIDYYETQSIAAAEEERKRDREIERDRWWLERATRFSVGAIELCSVDLRRTMYGTDYYWVIECDDLYLGYDLDWHAKFTMFSDREAALQAYEKWKQQQVKVASPRRDRASVREVSSE